MHRNPLPSSLVLAALALALLAPTARAATGLAYVSSEKDHALTIVDPKTMAVVGTIPTCKRPRHMQVTPSMPRLLMVACSDSGQADLIDLAARKSVGRVPLGEDPELFDLSPDGKTLYVSNEEDGEIGIVDIASKKRIGAVKVGEEPEGVKVSPDGKRIYVTSEVANMVHVVDAATKQVIKNIPVPKRPRRFAVTPDGQELWVTSELASSVSVISTRELAVTHTIKFEHKGMRADDISPVGIALSPDGKTAYVALGRANHVVFVDVGNKKPTQQVLVGKRAWNIAVSRDGSRLYVTNGLSDDLTVIDTASAKALKTIPVGRVPHTVILDESDAR